MRISDWSSDVCSSDLESGRLVLSVIEGRVSLADRKADDNGRAVIVTGGDMAVADGASTVVTADLGDKVSEAVSWRDGVLTFDQSTLPEAAAEFNRSHTPRAGTE